MNNRQLKKALAKSNIELFDTKKSKATKTTRQTKISNARGIKRTSTKKGFRGPTTKISKPVSSYKKTQQATKVYTPKKKTYQSPAFGTMPKPDMHTYGPFDGFFSGRGAKGIAGGLNRVEREYPGTFDIINAWVEEGKITWNDVQDSFAEYYFDDREGRFEYLLNPYEVFTSGYENFMNNLRAKAGE